jgi:hypothetical protein
MSEMQNMQQNYQNECFEIRQELYSLTCLFDQEEYNNQCKEAYIEIFGKEDYVVKDKMTIYNELCVDICKSISEEKIQETEEERNNLYKEMCSYIWNFNLSDEEDDNNEKDDFEYEKKPVLIAI